jgi:hypothetical protein
LKTKVKKKLKDSENIKPAAIWLISAHVLGYQSLDGYSLFGIGKRRYRREEQKLGNVAPQIACVFVPKRKDANLKTQSILSNLTKPLSCPA